MKVIAIVVFAGIWASSSAQYQPSYTLTAPAPKYQPSYQPPVYQTNPIPYTYESPAPSVPCPTNMLLSCAPSVVPVPCQSVSYEKTIPPPPPPPPTYTKPAPFPPNYR